MAITISRLTGSTSQAVAWDQRLTDERHLEVVPDHLPVDILAIFYITYIKE